MILTANDLSFAYKNHETLKKIAFSVYQGEITVILGPNGAGKTTLLKCLNRILRPRKGEVRINDKPMMTMDIKEISKQIAYVAQTGEPSRVTAFDAILMGRKPLMGIRPTPADLKKVDAVIKHLNLAELSLKPLDKISGGELQKVCIARALAQETDILLMDEPTASLDLKNQTHILNLIRHIVKDHAMASVMTMHDLNTALRYADRYIFLKDKTVYSSGKTQDITAEMVAHVYGLQVEILHHKGFHLVVPLEDEKAA